MAALTEKRVELLERALGPLTKRNRQLVVMGLDLSIEYDMYSVSFVDSAEGMRMEFRRRSAQERADGVEALPPNVAAAANEAAERKKAAAAAAAAKAAARTDAPGQKTNESMVRADAADKATPGTGVPSERWHRLELSCPQSCAARDRCAQRRRGSVRGLRG